MGQETLQVLKTKSDIIMMAGMANIMEESYFRSGHTGKRNNGKE